MGLKLEGVLAIFIIAIVLGVLSLDLENINTKDSVLKKDMEFTHTTFVEVDTQKRLSTLFGTYGIRYQYRLDIDNLIYHTDNIESLVSKKGNYTSPILHLDGDVVMKEKDGYIYTTQHAIYNQKTQILNITSPFKAIRDKNIFIGETLIYHTLTKYAYATTVDAIVYTAK